MLLLMTLLLPEEGTTTALVEEIFDQVVAGMVESGDVKPWKAEELIESLQESDDDTTKIPVLDLSESVPPGTVVPPVKKTAPEVHKPDGVAAGKVILLGEHAAVYDRNVLALPIESAVSVRIVETAAGIRLLIPDWKIGQQLDPDAPVRGGPAAEALRSSLTSIRSARSPSSNSTSTTSKRTSVAFRP